MGPPARLGKEDQRKATEPQTDWLRAASPPHPHTPDSPTRAASSQGGWFELGGWDCKLGQNAVIIQ